MTAGAGDDTIKWMPYKVMFALGDGDNWCTWCEITWPLENITTTGLAQTLNIEDAT